MCYWTEKLLSTNYLLINFSHIDLLHVENWNRKLMDSTKADAYRSYKNMPKIEKYFDHKKM